MHDLRPFFTHLSTFTSSSRFPSLVFYAHASFYSQQIDMLLKQWRERSPTRVKQVDARLYFRWHLSSWFLSLPFHVLLFLFVTVTSFLYIFFYPFLPLGTLIKTISILTLKKESVNRLKDLKIYSFLNAGHKNMTLMFLTTRKSARVSFWTVGIQCFMKGG